MDHSIMRLTFRLVLLTICCILVSCENSTHDDPCKIDDNGDSKEKCRNNANSEGCPLPYEYPDERMDNSLNCCCRCGETMCTKKDPLKGIKCHKAYCSLYDLGGGHETTATSPTLLPSSTGIPNTTIEGDVHFAIGNTTVSSTSAPETDHPVLQGDNSTEFSETEVTELDVSKNNTVHPNDQNGLPIWAVMVIVIGIIVLAIGVLIRYCWKKKNSSCCQSSSKNSKDSSRNNSDDTELKLLY